MRWIKLRRACRPVPILFAVLAASLLHGQTAGNRFVVVVDAAHGGSDAGATLAGGQMEKAVTLAITEQLRAALTATGMDVRMTRTGDTTVSYAARAQVGNAAEACVTIHATQTGSGAHVFYPLTGFAMENHTAIDQWTAAEAAPNHASRALAVVAKQAMQQGGINATLQPAADPTVGREHCPAIAIEVAPTRTGDGAMAGAADAKYQAQVVHALVAALQQWRTRRQALDAAAASYAKKVPR